ncbi:flavin reductase family protein [Desulfolutivibrio sulfoxidireducens]|uniref:flavin reductase family protein n=1 Tax=Desulfolutivibrio sulfoxidireducens TaxID=2773299 RepID=UPI00159D337B|nr:flavin reductase family protein [Desulfolutivibrio sulfoxidireducens]QLA17447.1 flavin reductase family protein [Desulfolutivibrio sulfoxidireducens]QLA21036.1 flavin reductase family protein [Desulfolutivibrio sulfoxidireducens]
MDTVRVDPNVLPVMPVCLVGSMMDGKPNFMTAAWLTRLSYTPPMVGVAVNQRHATREAILEAGRYSLCIPGRGMVEATDYCGLVSGRNTDKAKLFDVFYGDPAGPPMIRECPLCLEVAVTQAVEVVANTFFIGEITAAHAHADVLTDGRPDMAKIDPLLLTMPDNRYFALGQVVGTAWKDGKKLKGENA